MKVILINEEHYGVICIAKDYNCAIDFLIKEHWLDDDVCIADYNNAYWATLKELFDKNWKEYLRHSCDVEKFNKLFDGSIYLQEENVYLG